MSLLSRLSGLTEVGQSPEDVKRIGFDFLIAAMAERKRGHIGAQGIIDYFQLVGDEITQAQALYTKLNNLTNNAQREAFLAEIRQILSLAEGRYDDSANGGVNYGDLIQLQARIDNL